VPFRSLVLDLLRFSGCLQCFGSDRVSVAHLFGFLCWGLLIFFPDCTPCMIHEAWIYKLFQKKNIVAPRLTQPDLPDKIKFWLPTPILKTIKATLSFYSNFISVINNQTLQYNDIMKTRALQNNHNKSDNPKTKQKPHKLGSTTPR